MKKYALAIVETHATQFDGPLFRILAAQPDIDLTVYYTSPQAHALPFDSELNRQSGWDHDITTGYATCRLPSSLLERIFLVNSMVKPNHYDLVIVNGYNSLLKLTIAILGRFYGTAVGLRVDSVFTHRQSNLRWMLKDLFLPLLFRLYATGHPVGSLTRDVMRHYGMADSSLFYFPYAVDNAYLEAQSNSVVLSRNARRQQMNIEASDFVVLGVLKFISREDPLTLLNAYTALAKQYPKMHLILVGDGKLMADIKRTVDEEGLTKVHLPGYLPYSELTSYYSLADVFVHPAKFEPWGVSVNEAMVCGIPVILADTVGASADLVTLDETGLLFKAGQPESLARQIERLIENPDFARFMGINARKRVRQWSYAKTLQENIKALEFVKGQN